MGVEGRRSATKWIVAIAVAAVIIGSAVTYFFYVPAIQPTPQTLTPKYKMALVLGGDETDAGWSMMAINGVNLVKEKYGWQVDISRLVPFPDQARVISDYAQRGYDVVWTHGGQFTGTTYEVANQFPNTIFVQTPGPGQQTPPPNVVALGPAFQVTGFYQAGVLAGKMTKTNAVAVVFGQWFDYLAMEFYAFKAGAESVNPNIKVYARVAGTWGDASLGFEITRSLIQTKNVDVIAQVADTTGRGVIAASQQFKIKVIGTVGDQAVLAPDATLTSVMMDTPRFIETIVKSIIEDTFKQNYTGKVVHMDLGYLAPFHQFENEVPQEVKDLLKTTVEGIESGKIVVPRTYTNEPPADPPN